MSVWDYRNDACLCGSGKRTRECCLQPDGSLELLPCKTQPLSPKTGFAHPSCYVSALEDCSNKISREHYISHGILKRISDAGMTIQGFPWQKEQQQAISATALTGNILCERHNTALSGLDAIALRMFDALDRASAGQQVANWGIILHGHDVERWMLKTLLGMICSKNSTYNGLPITGKPNAHWLRLLFELEAFPPHWGMYFGANVGDTIQMRRSFSFATLITDPIRFDVAGMAYGAAMTITGCSFLLNLASPKQDIVGSPIVGYTYRPACLSITTGSVNAQIVLVWEGFASRTTFEIERQP
jgi:hypothetical protein